jgi:hypothetical protein
MADFSSLPIPPRNIGAIEPTQKTPDSSPQSGQPVQGASFKETLMKQLEHIRKEADQVADAQPPNYEDMDKAMHAAKTAYTDTMNAHQMMQQLFNQTVKDEENQTGGE